MIQLSELQALGIAPQKSLPIKNNISKSEKDHIPIEIGGMIQWVDPDSITKAIDIQNRVLDIRERSAELTDRKKNGIQIDDLKSYIVDPYDMYEYSSFGQIRTKRYLNFDVLRMMADTEIPAAIISTRIAQAVRFAKPTREGLDELGYNIRLRDRDAKATDQDKKRMAEIEQFFYHTGWERGYVGFQERDTLKKFLTKIIRDRLTCDKVNIELQRVRKGDIHSFYAVDCSTIYPLVPRYMKELYFQGKNPQEMQPAVLHDAGLLVNKDVNPDDIVYVQRIFNRDTAYFLRNEMLNICENPRTDIRLYGYGVAELELLIRAVTAWINGLTFSTSTFSEDKLPAGVLSVIGNWNTTELQDFKDQFYLSMSNPKYKHKIPIMRTKDAGGGVKFVEFKGKNATSEEQHKFLTFMAQICGALFRIDVEELGFQSVRIGSAPLSQASPLDKIKGSKDKGFEPLMDFIADIFNNNFLNEIDGGKYEFSWVGIKDDRTKEKLEIRKLRLETGTTVRQVLKENDEDLPEGENQEWLDAPANPILYQAWQSEKMAKAQTGGEFQMEGEEGAPGEPAPGEEPTGEEGTVEGNEVAPTEESPETNTGGRFKPAESKEEMGKSISFTVRRVNERLRKSVQS